MKRRVFAATVVLAALAALIVYKEIHRPASAASRRAATAVAAPSVVLIADPREADSDCGCGQIIRMMRAASAKGVAVREVAPGSDTSRAYHATVNPTVLFLDRAGSVVARYEGEAANTIQAIAERLQAARSR